MPANDGGNCGQEGPTEKRENCEDEADDRDRRQVRRRNGPRRSCLIGHRAVLSDSKTKASRCPIVSSTQPESFSERILSRVRKSFFGVECSLLHTTLQTPQVSNAARR